MLLLDWLKKALASKEVKAAFAALEEAAYKFQNEKWTFQIIRKGIEKNLLLNPNVMVRQIQQSGGRTPREWVYSQIGNIAGDMLETGTHHVYRGILNETGNDLLKMFDATYDELVQMKAADLEYATKQKQTLRSSIREVG
jgi:hypothetical protein